MASDDDSVEEDTFSDNLSLQQMELGLTSNNRSFDSAIADLYSKIHEIESSEEHSWEFLLDTEIIKNQVKEIRATLQSLGFAELSDGLSSIQRNPSDDYRIKELKRKSREIYHELRSTYPAYLTLLTILYSVTIPKGEVWIFVCFMIICECFVLQIGFEAWSCLSELTTTTEKRIENMQNPFSGERDPERASLLDNDESCLGNSSAQSKSIICGERWNLGFVILFASVYTVLLTIYMCIKP